MKLKITGRDIKFFFLGVFTILIIDIALDFDGFKKSIAQGWNDGQTVAENK